MSTTIASSSPLLDLAAELRSNIFAHAMDVRKLDGTQLEITPKQYHLLRLRYMRATLVNRQLRQELLPIYYGNNTFRFKANWRDITNFPDRIATDAELNISQRADMAYIVDWEGSTVPTQSLVRYGKYYTFDISRFRTDLPAVACMIELPPFQLRKFIRSMILSIPVPMSMSVREPKWVAGRYERFLEGYQDIPAHVRDWCYPVRELEALGLTGVEKLRVELRYAVEEFGAEDDEETQLEKVKRWFEGKIVEWDIVSGGEIGVTVVKMKKGDF